jgi:hypothetical protein
VCFERRANGRDAGIWVKPGPPESKLEFAMPVKTREKTRPGWPAPGGPARGVGLGSARNLSRHADVEATLRWLENREKGVVAAVHRRTRSALVRRLDRLNAPVVYPWSPSLDGSEPAHQLHRAAASLLGYQARGLPGRLWLWSKALAWPCLALAVAPLVVLRCWSPVRARHGHTLLQQLRDVTRAALGSGVFPTEYYHRRVFATAARADPARYLNEREIIALLSAADRGSDAMQVDSFQRLYAACRKAGIPVPGTIAVFSPTAIDLTGGTGVSFLPERDLFVRPEAWRHGDQGEYWRWNHQGQVWSHRGEALGASALLRRLRERASSRAYVLQECVVNHPELSHFTGGSLCTFRVATGMDLQGEPAVLFAACRFPGSGADGESPAAVDLTSGIDLETGRWLPAHGEFVADGEFDRHPGTGATITGTAIPHWDAVARFALDVHRHFEGVPFVGWEIGMGVEGPVLLDASTNWGSFPHVLPADTAFADLCLQHLMRCRRESLAVHILSPSPGPVARPGERLPGLGDRVTAPDAPRA